MVWTFFTSCFTKVKRHRWIREEQTEETLDTFLMSQWPQVPSWTFLSFRCFASLYFSSWLITSWVLFKDYQESKEKWLIYLTHWSLIVLVLQSYCLIIPILQAFRGRNSSSIICRETSLQEQPLENVAGGNSEAAVYLDLPSRRLNRISKVAWTLDNIASPMAIGVTIGYWGFLYNRGQPVSAVTVHTHGINAVYVIIDHFLCRRPRKLYHVYQPIVFGLLYTLFSYIYYCLGGTDSKGNAFIYPFLNWAKPLASIKYTLLFGFIASAFTYAIIYGLYRLRSFLYHKCIRNRSISHSSNVNTLSANSHVLC